MYIYCNLCNLLYMLYINLLYQKCIYTICTIITYKQIYLYVIIFD